MRENNMKNNNKGYTMIEMIIVIAIIAILSGMAMLTITSVRSSQASSSMHKFDSALSTLSMKTKAMEKNNAFLIVQNEANYDIYYGTYDANNNKFKASNPDKPDTTLERVTIYYNSDYSTGVSSASKLTAAENFDSNGEMSVSSGLVRFRKSDGKVLAGQGTYVFCKYNSTDSVGSVTLNEQTGSHTYGTD